MNADACLGIILMQAIEFLVTNHAMNVLEKLITVRAAMQTFQSVLENVCATQI